MVRISACHVKGPGLIPGRRETFSTIFITRKQNGDKILLAPWGIEPMTFALLARRSNQLS